MLHRGVPVEMPRQWTRGQTPTVEYTYRPLDPPTPPKLSRAAEKKKRGADARLRRALVDAWRDPARARSDLLAAGVAYADLGDGQGAHTATVEFYLRREWFHTRLTTCPLLLSLLLCVCAGLANAFQAHAQTRLADAHLAEWGEQLRLPASNMAREEYSHAHAIVSSILDSHPAHYSARRQISVHRVAVDQTMRPFPLKLNAEDARAADMGIGL